MSPENLQTKIVKIAEYLESQEKPRQAMTAASVRLLLTEIRTANEGADANFRAAINDLRVLISNLRKSARTLNPQDEARAILEEAVSKLSAVLGVVVHEFKYISQNT